MKHLWLKLSNSGWFFLVCFLGLFAFNYFILDHFHLWIILLIVGVFVVFFKIVSLILGLFLK